MSAFEDRVNKVVAPMMRDIYDLFQDNDWEPSFDPILKKLEDIFNLLKEVKSEVYKTEKQTTPDPEEEEKEKKKKRRRPTKQDWDDFIDLLRDDDPNNVKQWIEFMKRFEPELDAPVLPDGTQGVIVDDDTTLLEWILNDGPETSLTQYISSWLTKKVLDFAVDKISASDRSSSSDVKSYIASQSSSVKEKITELSSKTTQDTQSINDNVDDLEDKLEDCCESMSKVTSEINHKIDLLDPVTSSNNTLEILQKQKAIMASIEELRGRL